MPYASNTTIPEMARRILAAERIMITTHTKPDGDAMGSVLAMARALSAKCKKCDIWLMGPVESNLLRIAKDGILDFGFWILDSNSGKAGMTEAQSKIQIPPPQSKIPDDSYDLAIVLDTGAWSQLELLTPWLKKHHDIVIGIDHHQRGDEVASMRLVEPLAVSTTAVLLPLLDEMKCEITGGIGGVAEALFVGLATDSGWFRYPNAKSEAFAIAARLLECGVNKSRLYQILEETFGPQRLAIEARALASIEYARNGSIAIQTLRMQDFKETGASLEDISGLVNTPMQVGAVRASILLSQTEPGKTKLSFRSKEEASRDQCIEASSASSLDPLMPLALMPAPLIDVNQLAQKFGGGGHIHAAGARINKDIDEAKADVLAVLHDSPSLAGRGLGGG